MGEPRRMPWHPQHCPCRACCFRCCRKRPHTNVSTFLMPSPPWRLECSRYAQKPSLLEVSKVLQLLDGRGHRLGAFWAEIVATETARRVKPRPHTNVSIFLMPSPPWHLECSRYAQNQTYLSLCRFLSSWIAGAIALAPSGPISLL